MALNLLYKLWTSFIIKLSLFAREYQYTDIQSLTYWITLKPLLINFNCLLQHTKKSIQRKYKLSLQTNNFIKKIITITIIAVVTIATPCITTTNKDHVALYIIRKDVAYGNILKRNKKSLKLNLKLLIKINLANLMINLKNNLTNIL